MRSKAGPKQLGDMSVIIYSQNLRGMSDSKEAELASRLKSKRVFAACLQETHILGCKSWLNHGWTFIHNGLASRKKKYIVTDALCKKDTQPFQTYYGGYTFSEPPPEGGLDLVANRQGAI